MFILFPNQKVNCDCLSIQTMTIILWSSQFCAMNKYKIKLDLLFRTCFLRQKVNISQSKINVNIPCHWNQNLFIKGFTDKWITYLKDSICVCIYSLNMELKMTMEVNKIM